MTSGVEQLALSSRPLSGIMVNQPPIQITEAVAKELKLRDGQIVKALVEEGGRHLLLSANEKSFRLPIASIYSAGAALSLRYMASIYGRHLLPTQEISSTSKGAAPRTASSSVPPPLIQVALSYIGRITSGAGSVLDLASVLGASGFAASIERYRNTSAPNSSQLPQLPSKHAVTPQVVAEALRYSGLFSESILTNKTREKLDLKQTMLLLQEVFFQDIEQISKINGALDRLELSQLEGLIAQERRETLYRFAIPFQQGSTVQVEIEGRQRKNNEAGLAWSVALDTVDADLGEVSAKASLLPSGTLDIVFWADRPGTASLMKNMLPELAYELEQYQITLNATNVISGRRIRDNPNQSADGQGALLDLKT